MANQWFRFYAEFLSDAKVQMMPETYQRRLVMLFCMRCNGNETFQETEIAFQLRIPDDEWKATKADFISRGFIDSDNRLLNWDKRQYISDSSTNRVKKHRENKVKRFSNVTVTPPEQNRTDTEQIQKVRIVGTRFALTQLPEDWKHFCINERPDLDPTETFKWFHDYWIAVAGAKGRKLDWFATWRNWIRSQNSKSNKTKSFKPTEQRTGAITL